MQNPSKPVGVEPDRPWPRTSAKIVPNEDLYDSKVRTTGPPLVQECIYANIGHTTGQIMGPMTLEQIEASNYPFSDVSSEIGFVVVKLVPMEKTRSGFWAEWKDFDLHRLLHAREALTNEKEPMK